MYTLFVETTFKAQHQLTFENGLQEPLHEHDWIVIAEVSSDKLDTNDLVMDFEELKSKLDGILQDFRDRKLESLPVFEQRNVSAETLAQTLYDQLAPYLPGAVRLDAIEITEAPGCRARYGPA